MGRIGRTYPRHELMMTPSVPAAPVRRLPFTLWLAVASVCLLLLAWPLS